MSKPAYSQFEISLSTGLEVPQGNLKWAYGPSLSYNLSVLKVKNTWKSLKGAFGVNIGYSKFDNGDKVLEYTGRLGNSGVAEFSDYTLIMLSANCGWRYELSDLLEGSFGWDIGYYYSIYKFASNDDLYGQINSNNIEGKFAFSPRVGMAVVLTDEIRVFVQTRYNLCFRIDTDEATGMSNGGGGYGASSNNESYSGQGDFGRVNYIWSNTLGIQYRF